MENPLVSIIIPVYNGANFMREAIDSALAQTYNNTEVIVVNDGSTDNGQTDYIAKSYGNRIRYFTKLNGGVSSALNLGIREMQGSYFSWLSHDDVYAPDKIENQVAQLRKTDGKALACCSCLQIDENSKAIDGISPESGFKSGMYDSKDVLYTMLEKATLNGCCMMIPKEAFDVCGEFDESLRFCQDVFMWYKMFLVGYSLCYTEDCLVKSRVHQNQLTQTGQALFRKECCSISDYLMDAFTKVSDSQYNFLKAYLISDSRYLTIDKVKKVVKLGKNNQLISCSTVIKAYLICCYGKVRPLVRKIYYLLLRGIKTK